ncbi:hypothetical protein AB1388_03785 [Streptomyces hydrogenans]|uniref:hypothetical protein n=1 Tax=Streptomyces hydrogenans TaxID=1873719 RepID=UPI00345D587C
MGEAARGPAPERAMLVLGDDALAHRLAAELAEVYRRDVVLVTPGPEAAPGGPGRIRYVEGAAPDERTLLRAGLREAEPPALLWDLHPGYVLRPGDRVVVAATRSGLPELLGGARAPAPGAVPPQGAGRPG